MIINNSKFSFIEDRKGKARPFKSRFIEAGLVNYENEGIGQVLVKKETIDKFLNTMVGCPVIINHKIISDDNVKDESVGTVHNVWFNPEDGWFWCDGVINDRGAMDLIDDGISVSCSYIMKSLDDKGGMWHDNPFDRELLDGEFLHLALVPNPRYNDATIVLNKSSRIKNMFNLFSKKEKKPMEVKNSIDKNSIKDRLLEMFNTLLKGKGEVDGMSEEEFYKKVNEMLDELSYDKDEREAKEKDGEKVDNKCGEKADNDCGEVAEKESEEADKAEKLVENADEDKSEDSEKEEKDGEKSDDEKSEDEEEIEKDEKSFEILDNASKLAGVKTEISYSSQAERIALGKKLF